jgi:hypothetical protein
LIPEESPLSFAISPKNQCFSALIVIVVAMVLFIGPSKLGLYELEDYFPWTVAAGLTFLFGIANTVLSLSSTEIGTYWRDSIISYSVVMVVGALLAWALSGLTVYEAKSFSWIYIVFTFAYLLFMSMVQAMRKIVSIAQGQDARLRGERGEESEK